MKKEDLLEALGEIREEYILEAAPEDKQDFSEKEKNRHPQKKITWMRYRKVAGGIAAALVLFAGIGIYQKIEQNIQSEQMTLSVDDSGKKKVSTSEYEERQEQTQDFPSQELTNKADAIPIAPAVQGEDHKDVGMVEEAEAEEAVRAEEVTDETSEDAAAAEDDEIADQEYIGNPWVSCASLKEAEEITGFSIQVPEKSADSRYTLQEIAVMNHSLIEIRYVNAEGEEGYRIRKGTGNDPVDGDYTDYKTGRVVAIENRNVTLRGNGDRIFVAAWTECGYTYAITAENTLFDETNLEELIREIH